MFLLLALLTGPASAEETFPQPPELQRDVDFWVAIFTRYTTTQGVLHDTRNLAVVYEDINFSASDGPRTRQRATGKRRDAIKAVLRTLGGGKRNNLSDEEARILALWPDDVSNETLAQAVNQVRYQQGLSDRFREGLVRSGRWRDFIANEFRAMQVPVELIALPHVESSYNPAARSHVGASGIWQFTRSTGRRFMRVDHVLDERNDPFSASRAAGKLLAYNYSITGNWPTAITAYNHGLGGVRRAMREYGDTAYVDILRKYDGRTFGFASRNFYVAFLAAMHVDQNAEQFFPGLVIDEPLDYAAITLESYIPLRDLAAALQVSELDLVRFNPAIQATIETGNKHLPQGFAVRVPRDLLASDVNELVAAIPATSWHSEQLPDMFHTVQRGDTLSQIAESYQTRVSTLVALNGLRNSHSIRAGQKLRLPAAGPAPEVVAAAEIAAPEITAQAEPEVTVETEPESPMLLASDVATTSPEASEQALLSDPSDYSVADDGTIEIHPLETLGHYGDWLEIKTQRLRDLNGLAFRTPVEVGDRIRLDLDTVDAETFEARRLEFHRRQQDAFFREHVITGVTEHEVAAGESVWILSLRKYDVPIWLFRQYNPKLDLQNVRAGTRVQFPLLSTP